MSSTISNSPYFYTPPTTTQDKTTQQANTTTPPLPAQPHQPSLVEKSIKFNHRMSLLNFALLASFLGVCAVTLRKVPKLLEEGLKSTKELAKSPTPQPEQIWSNLDLSITLKEMSLPKQLRKLTRDLINTINDPKKFKDAGGKQGGNVTLLYGEPGTGKTTYAKAIAKEFDGLFASFDTTAIRDCYVGQSEKNLHRMTQEVIETARANPSKKVFVLFDELDSLAKKDPMGHAHSNNLLAELKKCLVELGEEENIHIIGTTNFDPRIKNGAEVLDEAIVSRLGNCIEVPLPTKKQLAKTIIARLSNCEGIDDTLKLTTLAGEEAKTLREACTLLANNNADFRKLNTILNNFAKTIYDKDDTYKLTADDFLKFVKKQLQAPAEQAKS